MAVTRSVHEAALIVDATGATVGLRAYSSALQRTEKRMGEFIGQSGYLALSLARIATYTTIFTFFGGLAKAFKDNVELQTRFAEVSTLVDTRNQQAAASLEKVKQQLLYLSPYLGTTTDLTKGLYEIMSAGVTDPVEAMKVLTVSAKYAKGGITDLGTAAATLTSIMKAYGKRADEVREVSDFMFASVMEGKFHAEDLNEALGRILPTAASMGVSIDEVAAAMAVLSQRGLDAGEAATALNRFMISFLKPLDKNKKLMHDLGIEYGLTAFQSGGLLGAIQKLTQAAATHSNLLPQIFTRERGLRAAFILTGQGAEEYAKMLSKVRAMAEGGGEVNRAYAKMIGTVSEEWKALGASVQQNMGRIFDSMNGISLFVRVLRELLVVIIRSHLAILLFIGTWKLMFPLIEVITGKWAVARGALETLRAELLYCRVRGFNRFNEALETELMLQEQHVHRLGKATRALKLLSAGVMVGVVVYIAAKAALDAWNRSLTKGIERVTEYGNRLGKTYKVLKTLQIATEEAGDSSRNLRKEFESALVVETVANFAKINDYLKITNILFDELRQDTPKKDWEELGRTAGGLANAILTGGKITEEYRRTLINWARASGFSDIVLTRFTDSLMKHGKVGEFLTKQGKQMQWMFMRLKEAMGFLDAGPVELASQTSVESLKAMKKAVDDALAAIEKKGAGFYQLENWLRLSGESIGEYQRRLRILQKTFKEAIDVKPSVDALATFQEELAAAQRRISEVFLDKTIVEERSRALIENWKVMQGKMSWEVFVKAHREAFKSLLDNIERVPEWMRKMLEEARKILEKGDAFGKLEKRAGTAADNLTSLWADLLADIEKMENELANESWKDIVARTKKEITLETNKVNAWFAMLEEFYGKSEALSLMHAQFMEGLKRKEELAGRVSVMRWLQQHAETMKEIVMKENDSASQRIAIARRMNNKFIGFMEAFGKDFFPGMVQEMIEWWEKFFGPFMKGLEDTRTGTEKWASSLGKIGSMLSNTTTLLREFFGIFGQEENKVVGVLDFMARGVTAISSALKAMNEVEKQATETTKSFADKMMKVVTVLDLVIAIGTTVIGVFMKLFGGKTEAEKLQEQVEGIQNAFRLLGEISESTAKKFMELRDEFGAATATLMSLTDMMRDTGITTKNYSHYMDMLRTSLGHVISGSIEAERGVEELGKAFSEMIGYLQKWGKEGDRQMLKFIMRLREVGLHVREVDEYVYGWLEKAVVGIDKMVDGIKASDPALQAHLDALVEIDDEMSELQTQALMWQRTMEAAGKGTDIWNYAKDQLAELTERWEELNLEALAHKSTLEKMKLAEELEPELNRVATLLLSVFNAALSQGKSLIEALDMIAEPLEKLAQKYRLLGLEGDEAINQLLHIAEVKRANEELFGAVSGLNEVLQALGNTGFLTQENLATMGEQLGEYFKRLQDAGLDSKEALAVISPVLANLAYYAEKYGWELDESTKSLIEQAKEAEVYHDRTKTLAEILEDGFQGVIDKLNEMMERMGLLPDEMDTFRDRAGEAWDRYNRGAKDAYDWHKRIKDEQGRAGVEEFAGGGGAGTPRAQAGMRFVGDTQLIQVHKGESILPENLSSALRSFFGGVPPAGFRLESDETAEVTINIDGMAIYKSIAPIMRKSMSKYGDIEMTGEGVF